MKEFCKHAVVIGVDGMGNFSRNTDNMLNIADIKGNCEVCMKGIDHSYYYEGYTTYKAEEL